MTGRVPRAWATAALLLVCLTIPAAARATVVVELSLEELVLRADAIVRARVLRTGSHLETYEGHLDPHTTSELAPLEWLKGAGGERLFVDELGGDVPDGHRWIAGTPRYAAGDEVVVFLRRLPGGAYRTLGLSQGRFEIRHAVGADFVGRTVVTRDTRELSFVRMRDGRAQVDDGGPDAEVDYDVFVSFVQSVLAQGGAPSASSVERPR